MRVVRVLTPPPRASLRDVWFNNARPGQKRQLVIVLPARGGGNSAVTLRPRASLEATLIDQPFTAQIGGSPEAGMYALDADDVRRGFAELIDDAR